MDTDPTPSQISLRAVFVLMACVAGYLAAPNLARSIAAHGVGRTMAFVAFVGIVVPFVSGLCLLRVTNCFVIAVYLLLHLTGIFALVDAVVLYLRQSSALN